MLDVHTAGTFGDDLSTALPVSSGRTQFREMTMVSPRPTMITGPAALCYFAVVAFAFQFDGRCLLFLFTPAKGKVFQSAQSGPTSSICGPGPRQTTCGGAQGAHWPGLDHPIGVCWRLRALFRPLAAECGILVLNYGVGPLDADNTSVLELSKDVL